MITTNKPTVLIAEDEDDLREMYTMALTSAGYNVLAAKNGVEALDWLDKKYKIIQLVILDIVMPEMDGFQVLEKIRKKNEYKEVPVLVSTNLDNDDDRREALKMGAKDYYVKSKHTPAELVAEVATFITAK